MRIHSSMNFVKADFSTSVLGSSNYLDLDSIGDIFNHKPTYERKNGKMLAYEKIQKETRKKKEKKSPNFEMDLWCLLIC